MSKKSSVLRNNKRIKMAKPQAPIRAELRAKAIDPKLSDEEHFFARMRLQSLPRNGAKERIRSRCQLNGCSRSVYRKFMISRITFREMAHKGLVPGLAKSNW